jgi:hypothetical protein
MKVTCQLHQVKNRNIKARHTILKRKLLKSLHIRHREHWPCFLDGCSVLYKKHLPYIQTENGCTHNKNGRLLTSLPILHLQVLLSMLRGVPVPTAWRVLGLRMRNGLQIWRLAANILNKQSWTDNKGWPSSLGVGRGVNNSSP